MKTSARNQWDGKVAALHRGAVHDEIEVEIPGGARIVATITQQHRAPRAGHEQDVVATGQSIVGDRRRARSGHAAVGPQPARRHRQPCRHRSGQQRVRIALPQGGEVVAIITNDSVASLGTAAGSTAVAIFKASSVLLAVRT